MFFFKKQVTPGEELFNYWDSNSYCTNEGRSLSDDPRTLKKLRKATVSVADKIVKKIFEEQKVKSDYAREHNICSVGYFSKSKNLA